MKNTFFSILFCLFAIAGWAQQSINTSGGEIVGSGGSASLSFGQIAFKTHIGTNGNEAQGVQQPYEISVALGIEEASGIFVQILCYPNPSKEFVMLMVEDYDFKSLKYELFDGNGKLFVKGETSENNTRIELSSFPASTYYLKITDNYKEIKNFKIVKN